MPGQPVDNGEVQKESSKKSVRSFAVMWGGQAVSLFGSRLVRFAVIWWLTLATGSATVLATVTMAFMLPQILAGPFAGSYVDRWNRKRVMMAADSLIAVAVGVLAFLFYLGIQQIWHIYLIMLATSLMASFHWPAMQASTTLLVPEEHYSRVGGLNQSLQGAVNIIAPPVGAVLYALFPVESILLIDIVTAFIAVASVGLIYVPQPKDHPDSKDQSPLSDMAEGIRFLRGWPGALLLIAFAMILNLIATPAFSLLPLLTTNHFSGDVTTLAIMQSANAFGMVAGGAIMGMWGGSQNRTRTAMSALVIQGIALFLIGMVPGGLYELAVILLLIAGLTSPIFNGSVIAVMQATIPPKMQGRVFSLILSGASAMSPIGLAVAGPVADTFGVPIWFVVSGLVTAILSTASFFVPAIMHLERRGEESTETQDETVKSDESQITNQMHEQISTNNDVSDKNEVENDL